MKSQSTTCTTKVLLPISSLAIVIYFLTLSSSIIEIKGQESGCPALNASKCIEMNCQNLARNETVQCLDQSIQIPQGTIATYRCKGKSFLNETWNMMCICHGRWMGIQRYIKYNAWCEANDPAPFVEDKEPGVLTQSEAMAATSERGRILNDTTTASPVNPVETVTITGPIATNTSTNPVETGSTNAPQTPTQLENSTQPAITGTIQSEGLGSSTESSVIITTSIASTTNEPSQQNGTTLPLESTTSQPLLIGSTTTPTQSTNAQENLLNNNASQVPPEARSLFNDTSNTTAPPIELGSTVISATLTTEPNNGAETTESPATGFQQTTPAGNNSEITTAGLTGGNVGTTTSLPSSNGELTTSTTRAQPQNIETTTQLPGANTGNGEMAEITTPSSILTTTSQTEPVSSPTTGFPIVVATTAASITTTGSGVPPPENLNSGTTTPSAAITTEAPLVTTVGASISSELSSPNFTDFQLVGLELHNKYRLAHNVSEVKLNQTLNEKAQSWAENQINEKTLKVTPGTRSYAENMYKVSGWKSITPVRAIQEAMKTWYSSIDKYNWTEPNPTGFSQIVWKTTSDIGVGIAKKNDVTVVAVTYWPRGNIILVGEKGNSTVDSGKLFRKNVFPKVLE